MIAMTITTVGSLPVSALAADTVARVPPDADLWQIADALVEAHRGTTVRGDRLPGLDAADGEVLLRRLLREAVVVPAPRSPETERES